MSDAAIEAEILRLCATRMDGRTVCPSEVARALTQDEAAWRALMSSVRTVAARLAADGRIAVTQRGVVVDVSTARGPVRLRRRETSRIDDDVEIKP